MPELLFDHDDRDCDIVYVPSQTIDAEELVKLLGFVHYEVGKEFEQATVWRVF